MDKVFTNIEYAAWLNKQAELKRPYWYGTYYLPCDEALLQKKRRQYPNHYGDSRMARYRQDIADGQICGDCVNGAIKGAVWSELGKRKPVYKSHDCPDTNADGMFKYCKAQGMDWGTIDTMPDKIGVAVRMGGHVGVYVGGGKVIEWRGFKYGCVKTDLKSRRWLHWYELPWVEYINESKPSTASKLGARLLKKGRKGEDVKELQVLLMELGYELPKWGADGDYGRETEKAVKDFQQDNGLEVDGDYGEKTHAALMAELAERDEEDDDDEMPKEVRYVTVTGGSVYIRNGAGIVRDIITIVHKGDKLPYIATASNGWHCVEVNGQNGWISGKYSTVEK